MRTQVYIISIILLISTIFMYNRVLSVYAQPSVELKVTRVVWGTDPDNPVKAYPGDEAIPLTIVTKNLSPNETIRGVEAVLILSNTPFTDIYGSSNATTYGEPLIVDIVDPTDKIESGSLFTLTFTLDIDPNALPGFSYNCDVIVNYSVNSTGIYESGEPQLLTASFVLSKISSVISCSTTPTRIEKGESVDVSGSIDLSQENLSVTLAYTRPNASTFNRIVNTTVEGSFRDSYQPDLEGVWSVNASWSGDERHKGDWAAVSFEVIFPVSLHLYVPDIFLIGDQEKSLNITVSNSGEIPVSSIDSTLTISTPPTAATPLLIRGSNYWSFKYLLPGNSIDIPVTIYAPMSALGLTYSASFDLSYRDDYGQTHSETYNLGFVVKGWIELIIYEKTFSPNPVNPGSNTAITATILNRGNVAAKYMNVTLLPSPFLDLLSESSIYVGEVEENSPVPFTVVARIKSNLEDGSYPVTVNVSYKDDQRTIQTMNFTLNLVVKNDSNNQDSQTGGFDLLNSILELKWILLLLVGAAIATFLLYRRRVLIETKLPSSSTFLLGKF